MSNYSNRWTVGEWTFYEVEDHGFSDYQDRPLYAFGPAEGPPGSGEYYDSLEWAMAAAIAEKHTGPRGAGGTGVGTAADWFMKMIGADGTTLKPAGENGTTALLGALEAAEGFPAVGERGYAERIAESLETRGYVIARKP